MFDTDKIYTLLIYFVYVSNLHSNEVSFQIADQTSDHIRELHNYRLADQNIYLGEEAMSKAYYAHITVLKIVKQIVICKHSNTNIPHFDK